LNNDDLSEFLSVSLTVTFHYTFPFPFHSDKLSSTTTCVNVNAVANRLQRYKIWLPGIWTPDLPHTRQTRFPFSHGRLALSDPLGGWGRRKLHVDL